MPLSVSHSNAIVLGGTGAVGSALVKELLASPLFSSVRILMRRSTDLFKDLPGSQKLKMQVIDMKDLEFEAAEWADGCNVAFCTLGVGQPRKVSKEELWKVDVEYVRAFGKGCKAAGVEHMSLLSAVYANSRSDNFYLHIKGNSEEALRALKFDQLSLFRPSLLVTQQMRYGLQDRLTQTLFPLLSFVLPSKLHEISVKDLAHAMVLNAEMSSHEVIEILHYSDFKALLQSK
jgi:uncharacterized protein YbjT (DUF2867 family)